MAGGSDALQRFYDRESAAGGFSIKKITTSGTHNLTQQERHVDVNMDNPGADITVNLPNAVYMPGEVVTVWLNTHSGTDDLVVNGPGVGTDYASGDMDAAGEAVVLLSDGMRWIPIHDSIP